MLNFRNSLSFLIRDANGNYSSHLSRPAPRQGRTVKRKIQLNKLYSGVVVIEHNVFNIKTLLLTN